MPRTPAPGDRRGAGSECGVNASFLGIAGPRGSGCYLFTDTGSGRKLWEKILSKSVTRVRSRDRRSEKRGLPDGRPLGSRRSRQDTGVPSGGMGGNRGVLPGNNVKLRASAQVGGTR